MEKLPDGLLVLDKPGGMTSRDAVNRVQRWFPRKTRIGHTGTLDPLATGVLVLCLGSATRLAEYVQGMAKTYTSTFLLGSRSDTDDADGTVTPVDGALVPDEPTVRAALESFVGTIEQVPPAYSAMKVEGKRAHAMARKGEEVVLKARPVEIYAINVLGYSPPRLEVEVHCGKGTYIRSLARDLGQRLGCGGLVEVLRRTRVGPFRAEEAIQLDPPPADPQACLLPAALALAELPRVSVSARDAARFRQGQRIRVRGDGTAGEVAVFDEAGSLVGVGLLDPARNELRPAKVL